MINIDYYNLIVKCVNELNIRELSNEDLKNYRNLIWNENLDIEEELYKRRLL